MSDNPHQYMLQIHTAGERVNSTLVKKHDLETIRTEASMVAEIFGKQVTIYSKPTMGGSWQILERIVPPGEIEIVND